MVRGHQREQQQAPRGHLSHSHQLELTPTHLRPSSRTLVFVSKSSY
jgi:hypothetical protein